MSEGRVFLRGITSEKYGLGQFRDAQLAAPRVRGDDVVVDDAKVGHSGDSKDSRTWWRVGPGDEPFLTQTLQVHFVEIAPGKANHGHGHQNEAAFYILQGHGHEVHDGKHYPWEKGDLVFVHTDSHHQHFNDSDEPAVCLVVKAKSTWMYFGLWQQGRSGPLEDEDRFGPREDWSRVWTPGVLERRKVVKPTDGTWETTPEGRIRWLVNPAMTDLRLFSLDVYEQEIGAGSRSGKGWHMADEVLYVLSGSGETHQWEVGAEIADKYYARVAKEPHVESFSAGDTVYVPQNHVHQLVNNGDQPLRVLSARNRLFRYLGYDVTVYLENAPEYAQAEPAGPVAGA
jgi:mannose-6-phosphate isomerase-like protein (cupin superfamily)